MTVENLPTVRTYRSSVFAEIESRPNSAEAQTARQRFDLPRCSSSQKIPVLKRFNSAGITSWGRERTPGKSGSNGGREDRKSTRLNSSHPSISYAVFCLKKKTK